MGKALRYSRQRERIYEYLAASGEHPSAEMIYTDLRTELPELSLGTVYRNLKLLEETGKIRKVTSYQGHERYDAVCDDHVHFICQECGAITDLFDVDPQDLFQRITLASGYQPCLWDLKITGVCPKCSQQISD